ncbi:TetR/AcrR family transcriptional regulator [Mycolicibacterium aichiense]|uniref:TetR family transcriptional regulator n=1 Tax=Mycolicibacterium aichiense TaxID=1799 RepID=A0AAD1HSF7_9MYCO|nr:TetR/AcrR family transcriptional regulator [Mycolicibacterium aichiense]MCV7017212.1 TetR/AcrR family transcriptional regulator [Mycolicibacterium aichiense]BBX10360.1 TetR family transcriptional regulator [Mycolicibacterium aichiense]STZ25982.1 TetR family transcriptional regulator [Mycolicibacterium aichiense]
MAGQKERSTRRRASPSKGDQRELAILDAAERQLTEDGLERMTVETIATAAGITRGALYFYFASKNDVLAALVGRTATSVAEGVDRAKTQAPEDPREALREAVTQTARMWTEHGAVMKVAVELAPVVPEIEASWQAAVSATADATRGLLVKAGVPGDDSPLGAAALSAALVSMTERHFYAAAKRRGALDDAAETLTHVWLAVLPR